MDTNLKFTIACIMKNEEAHLQSFLDALKRLKDQCFFEFILVDTGSTDTSIQIAKDNGISVFEYKWTGDFAAARNYAASLATNEWVLFLDCDEFLEEFDLEELDGICEDSSYVYMIERINYYLSDGNKYKYIDYPSRLYNKNYFHYEGIVHEQICNADEKYDYLRLKLKFKVKHVGYYGNEKVEKARRNIELLLKMLEKGEDPYVYFQLGQAYHILQDEENTYYYYGKGLSIDTDEKLQYVQLMVIGYGYSMLNTGRIEEALSFEGIYDSFSYIADFVCLMGLIYLRNGIIDKAVAEFMKADGMDYYFSDGSNSVVPRFNLGCINEVLGNIDEAVIYYKKCGSFTPALERLNELLHV